MRPGRAGRLLAGPLLLPLALSLAPDVASSRPKQVIPPGEDERQEDPDATGVVSRYRGLYGPPEFRDIDVEEGHPWPLVQAFRTVGVLTSKGGYLARKLEYVNSYARMALCGDRYCIGVTPVDEMFDSFHQLLYHKVEIVGAVDNVGPPGDASCPCYAFRAWSIMLYNEFKHGRPLRGSRLEALVRDPLAAAGRSITVEGTFRGANLFEDLPPETRRGPADWVLNDGPFSIWVTGRLPKGDGFSLDPRSLSDCRWRLEVRGKVETRARYIYLRAKSVALVRRETRELDPR
jgi:hypothetical protein